MAAWVSAPSLYLPVPTMRRDWKALPAITRGVMRLFYELVDKVCSGGGAEDANGPRSGLSSGPSGGELLRLT